MAQREGLAFESTIESDSAPLNGVVQALLDANLTLHCLRDVTRGGLASILNEIVATAPLKIELEAANFPIQEAVRGACELLGLDPLYIANEGCFVLFVPGFQQQQALEVLHRFHPNAAIIGTVQSANSSQSPGQFRSQSRGQVTLINEIGTSRPLDWLTGQQLPRIC